MMPRVEERLIAMNNRAEELFKQGKTAAGQDMLSLVNTRSLLEMMIILKRAEERFSAMVNSKSMIKGNDR